MEVARRVWLLPEPRHSHRRARRKPRKRKVANGNCCLIAATMECFIVKLSGIGSLVSHIDGNVMGKHLCINKSWGLRFWEWNRNRVVWDTWWPCSSGLLYMWHQVCLVLSAWSAGQPSIQDTTNFRTSLYSGHLSIHNFRTSLYSPIFRTLLFRTPLYQS